MSKACDTVAIKAELGVIERRLFDEDGEPNKAAVARGMELLAMLDEQKDAAVPADDVSLAMLLDGWI